MKKKKTPLLIPRVMKFTEREWEDLRQAAFVQKSSRPDVVRKAVRQYLKTALPPEVKLKYKSTGRHSALSLPKL